MGSVVHAHRVQYAVVEAHYSKARSERFVVAYVKEKSLRQFIAAPRIIASGFSLENEAEDMLDTLEAHQGRLRRLLLPPDAHLNTIADRLVGFVRSLFWWSKCRARIVARGFRPSLHSRQTCGNNIIAPRQPLIRSRYAADNERQCSGRSIGKSGHELPKRQIVPGLPASHTLRMCEYSYPFAARTGYSPISATAYSGLCESTIGPIDQRVASSVPYLGVPRTLLASSLECK
jgi:hypothetical protein